MAVRIEQRGSPAQISRRQRAAYRDAYRKVAQFWFRRLFPKHFTVAGGREYGYRKRAGAYMIRKARSRHHQRPHVWSDKTKRGAKKQERIAATYKGATVKMDIPRHYNWHSEDRRELLAVSPGDEAAMDRLMDRILTRAFNEDTRTEVKVMAV